MNRAVPRAAHGGHTPSPIMRKTTVVLSFFLALVLCVPKDAAADTTGPYVNIIAPGHGDTISGAAVRVAAEGSDDVGVVSFQFTLDGAPLGPAGATLPYAIAWDTTRLPNGNYTLQAVARDAAGNVGVSIHSVPVTISNAVPAPGRTGDLNGDNRVDLTDLSRLLSRWGTADAVGDINGNGVVDVADLSLLLAHWG